MDIAENTLHQSDVRRKVIHAITDNCENYEEVLRYVGSADPRIVREVYDEVKKDNLPSSHKAGHAEARRKTANLYSQLPAPNPIFSQWWFTLDTAVDLARRVSIYAESAPAAFLGTPTVGYCYAHSHPDNIANILDIDQHIVEILEFNGAPNASATLYDVKTVPDATLSGFHTAILLDPPWYSPLINIFLARACELITRPGFILCALPSNLTRPGILDERRKLLKSLLGSEIELIALETDVIGYQVPEFEARAYSNIQDFKGRCWRRGDLLILRIHIDSNIDYSPITPTPIECFARDPKIRRLFLDPSKVQSNLPKDILEVPDFSQTVSSRVPAIDSIAVWSSDKRGLKIRDANAVRSILSSWACGETYEQVLEKHSSDGNNIVEQFNSALALWAIEDYPTQRRIPEKLVELREIVISPLAASPSTRQHGPVYDGFRLDFQRDRDRILWSHSLKRLSAKTQLFSVDSDHALRRRLSHTIEVMQLASTVAVTFGLDRDLTEAAALAHDLGHTPFGHAGEAALNSAMSSISTSLGFNHYEHGVDVVRYLEDVYFSPGAGNIPGLNLTIETEEAILKHTFFRETERPFAQRNLTDQTKHADLREDVSCHLEGQSVRIADKISYIISDLEDGIRLGAIDYTRLRKCRFFEHPPIDMSLNKDESLYSRFISQRGSLLKVIMEDLLRHTDHKLSRIHDLNDVRRERSYLVNFSPNIAADLQEIWNVLQAGTLHAAPAVIKANARAARITTDLFFLFSLCPGLVESRFAESHAKLHDSEYLKWYSARVGNELRIPWKRVAALALDSMLGKEFEAKGDHALVATEQVILAKDYVASLTDEQAVSLYKEHIQGVVSISGT